MPREADEKRDYAKYRAYYIGREESAAGKRKRAERQKARREAVADGRLSGPHDPHEVDHKVPLAKGGAPDGANIDILTRRQNRQKYDH